MSMYGKFTAVAGISLAAVSLLLSATGCTGSDREVTADQQAMATRLADGFAAQADLDTVVDRLARNCMERKGFRVHPTLPGTDGRLLKPYQSKNIEVVMRARQILHEDRVAEIGYGVSPAEMLGSEPGAAGPAGTAAFEGQPQADQDRYYTELLGYRPSEVPHGDPEDGDDKNVELPNHERFTLPDGSIVSYPTRGCTAEVQQQLFDGKLREFTEASHYARDGLAEVAVGEVRRDPGVRQANVAWAECMRARGFDGLTEPLDARNRASSSYGAYIFGPDSPGYAEKKKAEITLAQADYQCNHQVKLDETTVGVFWRHVARFYGARESHVAAWRGMVDSANLRAQKLLGSGR